MKNANITVNSNTEAADITTNTPMLNIPQELTASKVSETATISKFEADNAKQCYLEIACKDVYKRQAQSFNYFINHFIEEEE